MWGNAQKWIKKIPPTEIDVRFDKSSSISVCSRRFSDFLPLPAPRFAYTLNVNPRPTIPLGTYVEAVWATLKETRTLIKQGKHEGPYYEQTFCISYPWESNVATHRCSLARLLQEMSQRSIQEKSLQLLICSKGIEIWGSARTLGDLSSAVTTRRNLPV